MEYTNKRGQKYYLHTTVATLRGGNREQTIYFFSKVQNDSRFATCGLPEGFEVVENMNTGLPCLRRVK